MVQYSFFLYIQLVAYREPNPGSRSVLRQKIDVFPGPPEISLALLTSLPGSSISAVVAMGNATRGMNRRACFLWLIL